MTEIADDNKQARSKGGLITAGVLFLLGVVYSCWDFGIAPPFNYYGIATWFTGAIAILVRSYLPGLDWKAGIVTVLGGMSVTTTAMAYHLLGNLIVSAFHLGFTALFLYAGFRRPAAAAVQEKEQR